MIGGDRKGDVDERKRREDKRRLIDRIRKERKEEGKEEFRRG